MKKRLLSFYKIYDTKSNLDLICDKKFTTYSNSTDVDFNFMRNAYSELCNKSDNELVEYVKNIEFSDKIFHPKQLVNIFGNKILIKDHNNKIYVEYKFNDYKLIDFIKLIETLNYDDFKNLLLELKMNKNFHSSPLLVALFIGNKEIGVKIINNLIKYKATQEFQLAICIKKDIYDNENDKNELITLLNIGNLNYILYVSNDLGNDITPTLLMYDDIRTNYYFDYVIKIHTKTNPDMLHPLLYTALSTTLQNKILAYENNKNSSSNGNFKFYRNIDDDLFNKNLYSKFSHLITKREFISGTIFFTYFRVMDNMIVFMKANYLNIFLQNTYDDNQLNKNNSYPHFMERLFGLIDNKYPLNAEAIITK